MLVAIMGNTFDMVVEKKAVYIMKSQLQTMSEYSDVINLMETDTETYLFIVKQNGDGDGEEEDDNWEGGFNYLKKSVYKKLIKFKD